MLVQNKEKINWKKSRLSNIRYFPKNDDFRKSFKQK
jgi:hypothetical protein